MKPAVSCQQTCFLNEKGNKVVKKRKEKEMSNAIVNFSPCSFLLLLTNTNPITTFLEEVEFLQRKTRVVRRK